MRTSVIVSVVLTVCLFGVCHGEALVGKDAPELTIRQWVTDNPPDIENLDGRVCVIEFWATWCRPCVEGIPHLIELNNKYKDKGLALIALSQDKSAEKLEKFVREKKISYNVAVDNGTADWFGIRGYPTAVIVNHEGKVVWRGVPWEKGFEKAIDKALAAMPAGAISGLPLGPFGHLREPLWGGKDFSQAYNKIRSHAASGKQTELSVHAKRIIETIDRNIAVRIDQADQFATDSPTRAQGIYADIVSKYSGIELVELAKTAYSALKRQSRPGF